MTTQYFRELQSLLQQFIIVEHAVEPAVDPAATADPDQQQAMDQAALETMKDESQAIGAADGSQADAGMAAVEEMMETSTDPSASAIDNQMAFDQDQQPSAEAFVADETGPSDIA